MTKKKILISGAGPAGLSAAILLDKNKYDVTVVERGPDFMNMGFSIILWHTGLETLTKILDTDKVNNLWPLDNFKVYGGENVELLQSSDTTGLGFSIERKYLMQQLSERFLQLCGADNIRFNTSITSTSFEDDKLKVTFSDGKKDRYDVLIAADGMHSYVRMGNFTTELETKPYKIAYGWIKPGSKLKNEAIVGFMKHYTFLIQTVDDKALLAYYNNSETHNNEEFLETIKEHIETERGGIFTFDKKTAQNFMSEKLNVKIPYNKNIVLIGDAYHGHPPTLGMGTSAALEDAYELVQNLNSIDSDSSFTKECEDAFANYTKLRHKDILKTYATQDFIETMIVTHDSMRVEIAKMIIKYGGWTFIEPLLRSIFSGSK